MGCQYYVFSLFVPDSLQVKRRIDINASTSDTHSDYEAAYSCAHDSASDAGSDFEAFHSCPHYTSDAGSDYKGSH